MKFVETYFPEADEELLIGTAYFSLRGYALARKYIPDAACIHFLVGKRDGHALQKAVLEEIKEQLCESSVRWTTLGICTRPWKTSLIG